MSFYVFIHNYIYQWKITSWSHNISRYTVINFIFSRRVFARQIFLSGKLSYLTHFLGHIFSGQIFSGKFLYNQIGKRFQGPMLMMVKNRYNFKWVCGIFKDCTVNRFMLTVTDVAWDLDKSYWWLDERKRFEYDVNTSCDIGLFV